MMKVVKLGGLIWLLLLPLTLAIAGAPQDNSRIEARIDTLMAKMTLAEKIGQLAQYRDISDENLALIRAGKAGSILSVRGAQATNHVQKVAIEESRLGIPLLIGNDVIHGYRTIFPIPLALASSWAPEWVQKSATVAAQEAAASGTHWTFAPMVDIARDPRWGRIAECAGEDPHLGSVMARAYVQGFQGEDFSASTAVIACAKHYVAYGAATAGRDYNTVDISEQTLREIYLPPFQAAIDAGAITIMSAFNCLNGVPASANYFTLTQILRQEWGFGGFVVSDWNSVGELLNHGVAVSYSEAGKKALLAGVDMDMGSHVYNQNLADLVTNGELAVADIDQSVRRILRVKIRKRLFEQPYVEPEREAATVLSAENLAIALQVARRSIVLLKNDNHLLPLSKKLKSLAVIGPLAADRYTPLGSWVCEGRAEDVISVLAGIKQKIADKKILSVQGCDIAGKQTDGFAAAVAAAQRAEVAVLVVGESANLSGEAASRTSLDLPGGQEGLIKAVYATGTPTVVVLMNGRPLTINWTAEHVPAILEIWQLGDQCGNAVADVLFGDYNPGGKLPVTFPRSVGQIPLYYNHLNTGRPPAADKFTSKYIDLPVTPLFSFGCGLSYTQFDYRDLQITPADFGDSAAIIASAVVQNTGDRSGDEVVQLYVQDVIASLSRPVKELKGFQRITLAAGDKQRVEFRLNRNDLGFYDKDIKYVVEPGLFKVWIGGNSEGGLEGSFEIRN